MKFENDQITFSTYSIVSAIIFLLTIFILVSLATVLQVT